MIETAHAGFLAIPDVVWSGIVGSLITIAGVLVTNRGLSARHREQLRHTASESAKAREMDLRKEVYIPAIEAALMASGAIGTLSDPASDTALIAERFSNAVASLGKVSSIAKPETVAKIGEFETALRDIYTRLLISRGPMMEAHNRWRAEADVYTRVVDDHRRWVTAHTESFLTPINEERNNIFTRQIEFLSSQMDHWRVKSETSKREEISRQIEFLLSTLPHAQQSAQASIEAAIAIRSEFSLTDDDLPAVRAAFENNRVRNHESIRRLVENLAAQHAANNNQPPADA
ncbi:MAG: hypothetical protein V4807_07235 [Burkholderia gladioli]